MKNQINELIKGVQPLFTRRRNKSSEVKEIFDLIKEHPLHIGAPNGVFRTETWVYEAILDLPQQGDITLETGAGASTLFFSRSLSAKHFVLTSNPQDEIQLNLFSKAHQEPLQKIVFKNKSSVEVLPHFSEPLGMALVDGCHGPFLPFIDFYYCAKNLKKGGYIIIDDIHLLAPKMLFEFVKRESEVDVVHSTKRAALLKVKNNEFIDYDWWQSGINYQLEESILTSQVLEKAVKFTVS